MSKIAKAAVGLMIATMLAKVLGFGREIALAAAYGTTNYTDAYLVALNIPTIIFASIGASLGTSYIPVYYDIEKNAGLKKANLFTSNILNIVMIVCLIIGLLGITFTEEIVSVFAMGFKGDTFNIAVDFTRILIIGVVFIGMSYLLTAYLQVKENFIVPGLISIPYNIIIIISIFISTKFNPYLIVYGTLIAMLSQALFQLPFCYKKGYNYKLHVNFKDENIKKLFLLLCPMFVGIAVDQVNVIVDRTLASTLVEGSIAALNYANKLNGFVTGLFIASIGAVIYPMLSKLSSANKIEQFKSTVSTSINTVILLVLPVSFGAMFLAKPIVEVLFQRGEFDARATSMTSIALIYYSIGMIGSGVRDILARVFYSIKDTKTPMIMGVTAMSINVILNLILVKYMKHSGLALATSISSLIAVILMAIKLTKKIGDFGQKDIIIVFTKSFISSLLMGFVALKVYSSINIAMGSGFILNALSLGIAVFTGATIYLLMIIILKVKEINLIINVIKSKIKK